MKAAVVGLGIGHAHCAGYLESPYTELAAVCDLIPERLAAVGGTFQAGSMLNLQQLYPPEMIGRSWEDLGVRTYSSLEALLADESIRIISLCTPDHTHADLATRILESGRHLLLEKPLALSLEDAHRIGACLQSAAGNFAVDYEFRLNPVIVQLKRLLAEGYVGTIEAFTLYHFRRPFKRDKWRQWIQHKENSGGLIVEETSHWLDLLRFVTGREVAELRCHTSDRIHADFDYEDIAFLQGKLEGGGIFQLSHALSGFDFNLGLTVHGGKGTVWCHLKDGPISRLDAGQTRYSGLVAWGRPNQAPESAEIMEYGLEATEPYNIKEYTKHFAECVAKGEQPAVGFHDAFAALELALWARDGSRA
ncbi:MAG: Gfo/Idh/MocA family oxidoreductase [Spirochaetaceae bacterium]|nr:MAG: Gfo/Idh/MocA family oxidoreductase [Spirochaetaceae bacterium]